MSDRLSLPSLTFFFPYREVSGVPVVFARTARYLAAERGTRTRVIDYPNGYMAQRLEGSAVEVIQFVPGTPLRLEADTVLVMQSLLPYTLRRELHIHAATRMVFWTLHPMNWVPSLLPSDRVRDAQAARPSLTHWMLAVTMPRVRRELVGLLLELQRKGAVVFMDGSTFRSTRQLLGAPLGPPRYLPVPCPVPGRNKKAEARPRSGELSVAWLGRIADFKIHILNHTLGELSRAARRRRLRVTVHVIGGGPLADRLWYRDSETQGVQIVRTGVLTDDPLDAYLLDRVDLLVAMGASALEGGRLGLPTILLDPFYGPVPPHYGFRWLHESSEYSLGEFVRPLSGPRRPLDALLDELEDDYSGVSERAFRYCRSHHALDHVADELLGVALRSEFRYGDFRPVILRRGLIRRAYELYRVATDA